MLHLVVFVFGIRHKN